MAKYAGVFEAPLFEAGYTLPLAGVPQLFDTHGLVPLAAAAGGASLTAPPEAVVAFTPMVGGYKQISFGDLTGLDGYGKGMWFNNNYLSFESNGLMSAALMDRNNYGVTSYTPWWSIPGNGTFGAPPQAPSIFPPSAGELNAELKVGGWSNVEPVNPDPMQPPTNVLVAQYGGLQFLGYGFSDAAIGGNIGMFAGITPLINAQFVKGIGATPGVARGYMWLPANAFRAFNLLIRYELQQYIAPDFTFRAGDYYPVTIEDGPLAGLAPAEVSNYRGGWTMLFGVDNINSPGSKWALAVLDHDMLTYRIVRLSGQTTDASKVMTKGDTQPTFKIDVDGIIWAMGGAVAGKVYTSFTARLDYAPAIYPVPRATFSLPCFNPCEADLWPSRT